jgi:hypothetical protein
MGLTSHARRQGQPHAALCSGTRTLGSVDGRAVATGSAETAGNLSTNPSVRVCGWIIGSRTCSRPRRLGRRGECGCPPTARRWDSRGHGRISPSGLLAIGSFDVVSSQ